MIPLLLQKYRIRAKAKTEIHLPEYKASSLRGVFGHAFKKIVCISPQCNCTDCFHRFKCLYSTIFDTIAPENEQDSGKFRDAPRPFVLKPPLSTQRIYEQDEEFYFEITLIGKASDYLPYFVYTFTVMGDNGIGKNDGQFIIENIEAVSADGGISKGVYCADGGILTSPPDGITFKTICTGLPDEISKISTLRIILTTPLRIEETEKGRLIVSAPNFSTLYSHILRRVYLLSYFHCGGLEKEPPAEMTSPTAIRTASSSLIWSDRDRYSNRKKTKMPMGGLIGEIHYTGNFSGCQPFLKLGSLIHIGKYAAFGNGSFVVEYDGKYL